MSTQLWKSGPLMCNRFSSDPFVGLHYEALSTVLLMTWQWTIRVVEIWLFWSLWWHDQLWWLYWTRLLSSNTAIDLHVSIIWILIIGCWNMMCHQLRKWSYLMVQILFSILSKSFLVLYSIKILNLVTLRVTPRS